LARRCFKKLCGFKLQWGKKSYKCGRENYAGFLLGPRHSGPRRGRERWKDIALADTLKVLGKPYRWST